MIILQVVQMTVYCTVRCLLVVAFQDTVKMSNKMKLIIDYLHNDAYGSMCCIMNYVIRLQRPLGTNSDANKVACRKLYYRLGQEIYCYVSPIIRNQRYQFKCKELALLLQLINYRYQFQRLSLNYARRLLTLFFAARIRNRDN